MPQFVEIGHNFQIIYKRAVLKMGNFVVYWTYLYILAPPWALLRVGLEK